MSFDRENAPDLGIQYSDSGSYDKEMGDLYSYSEYKDFNTVFCEFSLFLEEKNIQGWLILSEECKIDLIHDLFGRLGSVDGAIRQKALYCLMYLAQGCWGEVVQEARKSTIMNWLDKNGDSKNVPDSYKIHFESTKANILLLYKQGLLSCLIQLLNLETSSSSRKVDPTNGVTMLDTIDLRMCLNLLYTLMETLRQLRHSTDSTEKHVYEEFKQELSGTMIDDELLLVKLFNLLVEGSNGNNELLPLKKILLCAWKTILITFGDFETLENLRIQYRKEAGLTRHFEHTLQVLRERVPALKVPIPENQNCNGGDQKDNMWELGESKPRRSLLRPSLLKVQTITSNSYDEDNIAPAPPVEVKKVTTLPWKPKIDERELNLFLKYLRLKYFGLDLATCDVDTVFGLPEPIQEGIQILKQNLYTPLSEVQLKQEEKLNRYFMSAQDTLRDCSVETFYEATWRELRHYIISLLKLMLAATPLSVERDKYLNIDAEIDAKIVYGTLNHMLAETIGSDMKRHKDIVVKAISSILLLLLKHFKLNHVLQFEYLGSCLMAGNCIPFIVKYLNQNIDSVVTCTQTPAEAELEYPQCVWARPGNTAGSDNSNDAGSQKTDDKIMANVTSFYPSPSDSKSPIYSPTNIHSVINLLRILNKLVKNMQSRIMALIYFKSFAPLKAVLRIRHNVLQFYALKLIKLQSRYQGRQWRKVNIKILGYVFLMVRHRFHDDWAYGNELESKQTLDSQAEEAALKRVILRFNKRRYTNEPDVEFAPLDNTLSGALGGEGEELSDEFVRWWPEWLEQKVLKREGFEWDMLLQADTVM